MDDSDFRRSRTRRDFLQTSAAGMAVAAAYGLHPSRALAQGVPLQYDGSKFELKAIEPNAKRGGVLRICVLSRQPISICINRERSPTSARKRACSTI